jgi:ABC-2 type transport system permease protein
MKKKIINIILHRWNLLTSKKSQLLLLFAIVFFTLFIAITMSNQHNAEKKIPIAIVDLDQSAYSNVLITRLKDKPTLKVIEKTTEKDALSLIKQSDVQAAYILNSQFMDRLLNGDKEKIVKLIRAPSAISIGLINEIIASEINRLSTNVESAEYVIKKYEQYGITKPPTLWEDAWSYTDEQWEPVPLLTMEYLELGEYTKEDLAQQLEQTSSSQFIYILGIATTVLILFILISNQWLINEKRTGVLLRTTFTAIRPTTYVITSSLTIVIVAFLLFLPSLLYLYQAYDLSKLQLSNLLVYSFLYFICFSSISLFFATLLSSQKIYHVIMLALALFTTLFGGIFIKLSDITERLASIENFTPQHWYFSLVRELLAIDLVGLINQPVILLTSISLLFIVLSVISLEVKYD